MKVTQNGKPTVTIELTHDEAVKFCRSLNDHHTSKSPDDIVDKVYLALRDNNYVTYREATGEDFD